MFKLLWTVGIVLANGQPSISPMKESTTFASMDECETFGREMEPRVQDFVRGVTQSEWDHPVGVRFECALDGRDASLRSNK